MTALFLKLKEKEWTELVTGMKQLQMFDIQKVGVEWIQRPTAVICLSVFEAFPVDF